MVFEKSIPWALVKKSRYLAAQGSFEVPSNLLALLSLRPISDY
jgi:hypothetical protein